MENKASTQPYDNLLKRLVEKQPKVVLPMLFPGLVREVVGEVNIEILLPPRRADRVYKILPIDGEEEEIVEPRETLARGRDHTGQEEDTHV